MRRQPILARKIEIHQNDVDLSLRQHLPHSRAIACDCNIETAKLEILPDRVPHVLIVVDDKNFTLARHAPYPAARSLSISLRKRSTSSGRNGFSRQGEPVSAMKD